MRKIKLPIKNELDQLFTYDLKSGILFWKYRKDMEKRWNTRFANKPAGTICSNGYLVVRINKQAFYNHRIIYKIIHNQEPDFIDHENKNKLDNKSSNLIDTTSSGNGKNKRKLLNNSSGKTGVSFHKQNQKWHAKITSNKKTTNLGFFENFNDAVYARQQAEINLGFNPRHGL